MGDLVNNCNHRLISYFFFPSHWCMNYTRKTITFWTRVRAKQPFKWQENEHEQHWDKLCKI